MSREPIGTSRWRSVSASRSPTYPQTMPLAPAWIAGRARHHTQNPEVTEMNAEAAMKGATPAMPQHAPRPPLLCGSAAVAEGAARSTHGPSSSSAKAFQAKCLQLRCTKHPNTTPGSPPQVLGTMPRRRAAPAPSAVKPLITSAARPSSNSSCGHGRPTAAAATSRASALAPVPEEEDSSCGALCCPWQLSAFVPAQRRRRRKVSASSSSEAVMSATAASSRREGWDMMGSCVSASSTAATLPASAQRVETACSVVASQEGPFSSPAPMAQKGSAGH
mmetsp:Transcript_453/g.820  ORF Transcript_453/g.820 Transcript_453/m.820 type:complete len:277 (+) Transcript_453:405-1235(+)